MTETYRVGQKVRWFGPCYAWLYEGRVEEVKGTPETAVLIVRDTTGLVWPLIAADALVEVVPWTP